MKFLVMWQIELGMLSRQVATAVARMPEYGPPLERAGKVIARYHVVGAHGGASGDRPTGRRNWILGPDPPSWSRPR
jgi:hypothetical protein